LKNIDFNINKLILYSDTIASCFALDITKKSIEKNIKIPDLLLLIHPYAIISTISTEKEENYLENLNFLDSEDKEIFLTFDILKNEIINLKFQDLLINSNNNNANCDIENLKTFSNLNDKDNENDNIISRLNLTENNNNKIYESFPFVNLIIPQNEIIRENSYKLFEFLK